MPTHRQQAQAVIEFAFVAPVLVALALGILCFGRVFYSYTGLASAAHEGARQATLLTTTPCPTTCTGLAVPSAVRTAIKSSQPDLAITDAGITLHCLSDRCRVDLALSFDSLVPASGLLPFLGTTTLSTSATLPLVNK